MQTQGKELAIIFDNGHKLLFGLGAGGYFYVGASSEINEFPCKERTNFYLVGPNGKSVFVCECNNTQNQVLLAWRDEASEAFPPLRGPDILDSTLQCLEANIMKFLDDDNPRIQKYFKVHLIYFKIILILTRNFNQKASLLDLLQNQTLFNGIGEYTCNELLHWLWLINGRNEWNFVTDYNNMKCSGTRPWANGAQVLRDFRQRELILKIARLYFSEMVDYVKPGTVDSKVDCNKFIESKWHDFRAIFVRCYRRFTAENRNRQQEVVVKYKKSFANTIFMKVTKDSGKVYLVGLTDQETAELADAGWIAKKNNPFQPNSLGVGIYNWWGPKERKTALESPKKEVC